MRHALLCIALKMEVIGVLFIFDYNNKLVLILLLMTIHIWSANHPEEATHNSKKLINFDKAKTGYQSTSTMREHYFMRNESLMLVSLQHSKR